MNNGNQQLLLIYGVMECKYLENASNFFPNHLQITGMKEY